MHSHNMLMVLNPRDPGAGYCKLYINGRRVTSTRWDLCKVHAVRLECLQTTRGKDGRIFHRQIARTRGKI